MKFLDLAWQQEQLEPEISRAIAGVLSDSTFIMGPAVRAFELAFANYLGVNSCVACGNGTDALELVLEALEIGDGHEVIVPAMTFVSTSEAVFRVGARPVLVDVDSAAVLDFDEAIASLSSRTRAIIVVHLYGYPADVDRLRRLLDDAGRQDVLIIEDAAQGHGASLRGCRVGALGDAACFSFYPGKNLGAFGDAGAVTTSDPSLAEQVRRIANHGRLEKFDHTRVGRNSRMDSMQAAVLGVKLMHLDGWISRRNKNAELYLDGLRDLSWLSLPEVPVDGIHGWHQFAIEVPERNSLKEHLDARGIPTGIHYPQGLPDFPFHADTPLSEFPRTAKLSREELSLPIAEHLDKKDVRNVIEAVREFKISNGEN